MAWFNWTTTMLRYSNGWKPPNCAGASIALPDGYRVVLNLFAIEGYSHKEIAEMLGINEGTSRSQYARAKIYLQKMLQKAEMM